MVGTMKTARRRRLRPDDSFLAAGNDIALRDAFTQVFFYALEQHEEESSILETKKYPCSAYGCHQVFESLEECDSHYFNMHTRQCRECGAVLPNDHLLDLHISESHDSYFASALERKRAKYSCLIATCSSSFECERARNQHLKDIHLYPRWFRFHPRGNATRGNKNRNGKGRRQGKKKHRNGRRGAFEPGNVGTNTNETYDERTQKQLERKKARKERQKKARALIPCKFHLMEGGCERGDRCDFLHASGPQIRGPPVSQNECSGPASDTDMAIDTLSNQLERS